MDQSLPRSTRTLLNALYLLPAGPKLDIGSHQGAVAAALECPYLHDLLTECEAARRAGLMQVHHADQLPDGPYAAVAFDARTYETNYAAEMVLQAARHLRTDGVLLTTARLQDVAPHFGHAEKQGEVIVARLPNPTLSPEVYAYMVDFAGQQLPIQSAPGIFSPHGMDPGTAVMLNVITPSEGARFLDLGCGVGLVSKVASEVWGCQVTAVDVSARALRYTRLNAPGAQVVASDGLTTLQGERFDYIASNPPYHTDFGVAKAFIERAHRQLSMEGTLALVVKRADWYVQKVRHTFGGCQIVEQDGYTVVLAQKRERKPGAAPVAPATTKKHAKRMAAAQKRSHRK